MNAAMVKKAKAARDKQRASVPLHRIVRASCRYINNTPELLSLLYDLDLLPEQLKRDSFQWRQMLILTNWHHKTRRQRPNEKGQL